MRKLFWAMLLLWIIYSLGDGEETNSSTPDGYRPVASAAPKPKARAERLPVSPDKVSPARETLPDLYVTADRVNQRAGPATNERVLGQLNKGARVRQISRSNGWTEIVSSVGRGWMSSQFLSANAPRVTAQPKTTPKRTVAAPTSAEIRTARQELIRQSIASYQGSCPCPYNVDRAGRRCGARSAWSRPGGYSPMCYDSDVSDARLATYFARKQGATN